MNEINYPSDELTDDFLHAQADAGEHLLDEEGFPVSANPGRDAEACTRRAIAALIDCLKGK
jgi:hypothetical protein